MTGPLTPHRDQPGRSAAEVAATLDVHLSRRDRLRYLAVLVASLAVTAVVATLWATEPDLPVRTHVAFAAIVAIGTGWVVVTSYILTRRRPLFALDRVLAATVAVVAAATVGTGTAVLSAVRGGWPAALVTGLVALALTATALVLLRRARARRRHLLARRAELEGARHR